MRLSTQQIIEEDCMTDKMLEIVPFCKTCGKMLSGNDIQDKRMEAVGEICVGCESKKYGATLT